MLSRPLAVVVTLLLAGAAARAEDEVWYLMLVDGAEAGYLHSVTEPTDDGGHVTTVDSLFRMKRLGSELEVRTTATTTEDVGGQITRIRQLTKMAATETVAEGVVRDGMFEITTTTMGKDWSSSIEWPDDVPGPVELERRRVATGMRPGASLTFVQFDFTVGETFEMTMTVVGPESLEIDGQPRQLVKVRTTSDLVPETFAWIDQDGQDVMTSTNLMGLEMTTRPTTREKVSRFLDSGASAEMFLQSTIKSNVRLPRPRSLTSITFRLIPKQPDATLPALDDERQTIVGRDGRTTILRNVLVVPPDDRRQRRPLDVAPPELAEYLAPNSMLQSDDPRLVEMAARGVAGEPDAWRAAQKLEALVHEVIDEKSLDVAFATALEVCVDRRGDCSEHAVLLAALCRSAGIPSRVAMGLVYVGGIFGGHAWTEVSIDGKWYALDGTIGSGSADPTHIRFGTSSLESGGLSSGMLGIVKGLGSFDLEIVRFAHGEEIVDVASETSRTSVEDGVFRDRIEGLSFAVPEGFLVEAGAPNILEMSNTFTVARLRSDRSKGTLVVQSLQVPRDYPLSRFITSMGGDPESWDRRRIAGHDGFVGSVRSDGVAVRAGAYRVGDTIYSVTTADPDDGTLEAFEVVLGTLRTSR